MELEFMIRYSSAVQWYAIHSASDICIDKARELFRQDQPGLSYTYSQSVGIDDDDDTSMEDIVEVIDLTVDDESVDMMSCSEDQVIAMDDSEYFYSQNTMDISMVCSTIDGCSEYEESYETSVESQYFSENSEDYFSDTSTVESEFYSEDSEEDEF